jgi:hypothetical protein
MIGVIESVIEVYESIISTIPPVLAKFLNLFLLVILIVAYAVFIWKFYRFIARKNIIGLNLNRFNHSSHPLFEKIVAGFFYLLEYIVILPFLIFFWFAVFTFFLLFLNESLPLSSLLLVSATVIAAIRMASYYNEDLSKDIAKLFPFTLLAVSVLTPGFFQVDRIIDSLNQIGTFLGDIITYLAFIIILEIILRFFDFILALMGLDDLSYEENN